jgi:hypothetical protein
MSEPINIQDLPDGTIILYCNRRYVVTRDSYDINRKILVYIDRKGAVKFSANDSRWKSHKVIFNPETKP